MYLHPSEWGEPRRTCAFTSSPVGELNITTLFGYSVGNVQRIKHLSPNDIIPLAQKCDGYLLLELRSVVAPESMNAFIGISTNDGYARINDAHVPFELREFGICEKLIELASHMLGLTIHGVTPSTFRYL